MPYHWYISQVQKLFSFLRKIGSFSKSHVRSSFFLTISPISPHFSCLWTTSEYLCIPLKRNSQNRRNRWKHWEPLKIKEPELFTQVQIFGGGHGTRIRFGAFLVFVGSPKGWNLSHFVALPYFRFSSFIISFLFFTPKFTPQNSLRYCRNQRPGDIINSLSLPIWQQKGGCSFGNAHIFFDFHWGRNSLPLSCQMARWKWQRQLASDAQPKKEKKPQ